LTVPTPEASTSRGREPSRRITRATPKAKEAGPSRSKSKGKGKAKVDDGLFDEAWNEELAKLKAKKAAIQAMIDRMEG
jgi:hypothetical protein